MGRIGIRISVFASLLFGCGSVKDSGGPIDAAIDANTIDADQSGNVTVTTRGAVFGDSFVGAKGDIDLISSLPNSTSFATGKSDGSGNGSIKVVPGGSVTAAYKHTADMGFEFITFVGVKPGDTLEFGNRQPFFVCNVGCTNNNTLGAVNYTWTVQPGATRTILAGSCFSQSVDAPGAATSGNENPSCTQNPMDTLFVSLTGTAVSGCTTRQNVAFPGPVNGGTPSSAPFAVTANVTGIPADFTSISAQFTPVINNQFERNVNFVTGFARATGTLSGGAFTGNFQYCNLGERTSSTISLNRPGFQQTRIIDSLPSNAATITVASPMLPPAAEGSFLASASGRRAAWALGPTAGTSHDAVIVSFGWSVNLAGVNHTSFWHFVLPPNTTEITFPKLPSSFEQFLPSPEFGLGVQNFKVVEIPTISSYDAYRAQGAATALCPECAARAGDIQRVIISGF